MGYSSWGLGLIGLVVTMAIAMYLLKINVLSFKVADPETGVDVNYGNVIEEAERLKQKIENKYEIE